MRRKNIIDKEKYLADPRFKGIDPFENKVWLSSPTMHGDEQRWRRKPFRRKVDRDGSSLWYFGKN